MKSHIAKDTYLSTPIYYVNGLPHVGHVYSMVIADFMARCYRLFGGNVFLSTGTDEHGAKVMTSASKQNMATQTFRDIMSNKFLQIANLMNISFNKFIRTSSIEHHIAATDMWNILYNNGYIYPGIYSGWYSIKDEAYYTNDELVDGKAPTGSSVEWTEEKTFFFRLSEFVNPLKECYQKNRIKIVPHRRLNEVMKFLERDVQDLCVARLMKKADGIVVPNNPDFAMYVWMDALVNYLTCIGYPNTQNKQFEQYSINSNQIVGKEILIFHAIYWPAMLLAAKQQLPRNIYVHGWLLHDNQKMSKSDGNVIDPLTLIDRYSVDSIRYSLLKNGATDEDSSFSDELIQNAVNIDLPNEFGNLIQRILIMIRKQANGFVTIHEYYTKLYTELSFYRPYSDTKKQLTHWRNSLLNDWPFANEIMNLIDITYQTVENIQEYLKDFAIHRAVEQCLQLASHANKYINLTQPWTLSLEQFSHIMYPLLHTNYVLAHLLYPIMPTSALYMLYAIGYIKNIVTNNDKFNIIFADSNTNTQDKYDISELPVNVLSHSSINALYVDLTIEHFKQIPNILLYELVLTDKLYNPKFVARKCDIIFPKNNIKENKK